MQTNHTILNKLVEKRRDGNGEMQSSVFFVVVVVSRHQIKSKPHRAFRDAESARMLDKIFRFVVCLQSLCGESDVLAVDYSIVASSLRDHLYKLFTCLV